MNTAEELDTMDDTNEETLEAPAPIGPAESQRLQLMEKAKTKVAEATETLKTSREALKAAKKQVVQLGPSNMPMLTAAKNAIEHNELCVEHHEAILATLNKPELLELVEDWDQLFGNDPNATHASLFLADISPEIETMKQAAKAFAEALATTRNKYNASLLASNEAGATAKALAAHGIRVRIRQPTLNAVQQAASGALRNALLEAGLGLSDHFVAESLRPDHYVPPEALKGVHL
jgi:soluble cytochrome b562